MSTIFEKIRKFHEELHKAIEDEFKRIEESFERIRRSIFESEEFQKIEELAKSRRPVEFHGMIRRFIAFKKDDKPYIHYEEYYW